jgi:glycosidase
VRYNRTKLLSLVTGVLGFVTGCANSPSPAAVADPYAPKPYIKLTHPEWARSATIYQLNTRQFTAEGTFRAAEEHLPRLKELGIDIVWLMPINPIGEIKRKGQLGSPYSIRDYYGVNPEFGTLDDLKRFVASAHELGMHVIIDWVAAHSAWDNSLVAEHPEWYERNWKGELTSPEFWDWWDTVDFDYDQPGLRKYMIDAMKYWVQEADIDGFRCDVVYNVPLDFWNQARKELDAIKPVFMLAEWEGRDIHAEAFDASYAFKQNRDLRDIVDGKRDNIGRLVEYYAWITGGYPRDAYRLTHVTNHDLNAWEGTQFDLFGDALELAIVLSVVNDGIPMVYNGQEAGNDKMLKFFDKDEIVWREHPIGELYRKLFKLKHDTTALWNGAAGAPMVRVFSNDLAHVFSFIREDSNGAVFSVFNISPEERTVKFLDGPAIGEYRDFFADEAVRIDNDTELSLPPWGFKVYVAH